MKLLVILMLAGCAYAATAPKSEVQVAPGKAKAEDLALDILKQTAPTETRNWLVDQMVNQVVTQAINIIRRVINNNFDPLEIDHLHASVPAELINLELDLDDVFVTGFGGFVMNRNRLNIRTLELNLDLTIPRLVVRSKYDLSGDLFRAIPLYGKGDAEFIVENFRVSALVHLGQSEDEKSVIIRRIEDVHFEIPALNSDLSGVIGGGDIDAIVNSIIEDVIIDYIHRFRGAIGILGGRAVIQILNPVLNQLDTWRFLAPFV